MLRGSSNKKRLPYRTFHYSFPVSGISRISIWTNPPDGVWFVRIIGGGTALGSFIWRPSDRADTFSRSIILVQAKDGGWEVSKKPKYVAGNIDWKGPIATTDLFGNLLDEPKREVLTWFGPDGRYGPQRPNRLRGGAASGGEGNRFGLYVGHVFIYRNGKLFIAAPVDGEPEGTLGFLSGSGDPFRPASVIEGRVLGAAFQEFDGERFLIVITDFLNFFTGTGAISSPRINNVFGVDGPDGLGDAKLFVWSLEISRWTGTLSNRQFDPAFPRGFSTGPGGIQNFRGTWVKIAELSFPTGFAPERWIRSRMFFFNEDGTEAVTMLPISIPDASGDYKRVRVETGWNGYNFATREATLAINITGNTRGTAVMTLGPLIDGVVSGEITQNTSFTVAGGTTTVHTDLNGDCAPEFSVTNSFHDTDRAGDETTTFTGGPWHVASDYKGNTKVTANISMRPGVGEGTDFRDIVNTVHEEAIGSLNRDQSEGTSVASSFKKTGFQLTVGSKTIPISGGDFEASGEETWVVESEGVSWRPSTFTPPHIVSESGTRVTVNEDVAVPSWDWEIYGKAAFLWMDLREDILVWSVKTARRWEGTFSIEPRIGLQIIGGLGAGGTAAHTPDEGGRHIATNFIQVFRSGALIDEYSVEGENNTVPKPSFRRFGSFFVFPQDFTFESSTTFPENAQEGDNPFCNRQSPTGEEVEWENESHITGIIGGNGTTHTNTTSRTIPSFAATPSLERIAGPDLFGDVRTNVLAYEMPFSLAVDGGGNLAYSIFTQAERTDAEQTFLAAGVAGSSIQGVYMTVPTEPKYMNHIDNGDFIDVMNQVVYIRTGPDGELDTADDIIDPPLTDLGGHGVSFSVKVIG
jgi:hypothetical protein